MVGEAVVDGVNLPVVISGVVGEGMPVRSEAWVTPGVVSNMYELAGVKSWLSTDGKALRWLRMLSGSTVMP